MSQFTNSPAMQPIAAKKPELEAWLQENVTPTMKTLLSRTFSEHPLRWLVGCVVAACGIGVVSFLLLRESAQEHNIEISSTIASDLVRVGDEMRRLESKSTKTMLEDVDNRSCEEIAAIVAFEVADNDFEKNIQAREDLLLADSPNARPAIIRRVQLALLFHLAKVQAEEEGVTEKPDQIEQRVLGSARVRYLLDLFSVGIAPWWKATGAGEVLAEGALEHPAAISDALKDALSSSRKELAESQYAFTYARMLVSLDVETRRFLCVKGEVHELAAALEKHSENWEQLKKGRSKMESRNTKYSSESLRELYSCNSVPEQVVKLSEIITRKVAETLELKTGLRCAEFPASANAVAFSKCWGEWESIGQDAKSLYRLTDQATGLGLRGSAGLSPGATIETGGASINDDPTSSVFANGLVEVTFTSTGQRSLRRKVSALLSMSFPKENNAVVEMRHFARVYPVVVELGRSRGSLERVVLKSPRVAYNRQRIIDGLRAAGLQPLFDVGDCKLEFGADSVPLKLNVSLVKRLPGSDDHVDEPIAISLQSLADADYTALRNKVELASKKLWHKYVRKVDELLSDGKHEIKLSQFRELPLTKELDKLRDARVSAIGVRNLRIGALDLALELKCAGPGGDVRAVMALCLNEKGELVALDDQLRTDPLALFARFVEFDDPGIRTQIQQELGSYNDGFRRLRNKVRNTLAVANEKTNGKPEQLEYLETAIVEYNVTRRLVEFARKPSAIEELSTNDLIVSNILKEEWDSVLASRESVDFRELELTPKLLKPIGDKLRELLSSVPNNANNALDATTDGELKALLKELGLDVSGALARFAILETWLQHVLARATLNAESGLELGAFDANNALKLNTRNLVFERVKHSSTGQQKRLMNFYEKSERNKPFSDWLFEQVQANSLPTFTTPNVTFTEVTDSDLKLTPQRYWEVCREALATWAARKQTNWIRTGESRFPANSWIAIDQSFFEPKEWNEVLSALMTSELRKSTHYEIRPLDKEQIQEITGELETLLAAAHNMRKEFSLHSPDIDVPGWQDPLDVIELAVSTDVVTRIKAKLDRAYESRELLEKVKSYRNAFKLEKGEPQKLTEAIAQWKGVAEAEKASKLEAFRVTIWERLPTYSIPKSIDDQELLYLKNNLKGELTKCQLSGQCSSDATTEDLDSLAKEVNKLHAKVQLDGFGRPFGCLEKSVDLPPKEDWRKFVQEALCSELGISSDLLEVISVGHPSAAKKIPRLKLKLKYLGLADCECEVSEVVWPLDKETILSVIRKTLQDKLVGILKENGIDKIKIDGLSIDADSIKLGQVLSFQATWSPILTPVKVAIDLEVRITRSSFSVVPRLSSSSLALAKLCTDLLPNIPAPIKLRFASPAITTDGEFRAWFDFSMTLEFIGVTAGGSFSVGKGGIKLAPAVSFRVPGWYDLAPPLSFGKIGGEINLEKRTARIDCDISISPGLTNAHLLSIQCQLTLDFRNWTLAGTGVARVLDFIDVGDAVLTCNPREATLDITGSIRVPGNVFRAGQRIRIDLNKGFMIDGRRATMAVSCNLDVFGHEIASVEVAADHTTQQLWAVADVRVLGARATLKAEFGPRLSDPRVSLTLSVSGKLEPIGAWKLGLTLEAGLGHFDGRLFAECKLGRAELSITGLVPGLRELLANKLSAEDVIRLLFDVDLKNAGLKFGSNSPDGSGKQKGGNPNVPEGDKEPPPESRKIGDSTWNVVAYRRKIERAAQKGGVKVLGKRFFGRDAGSTSWATDWMGGTNPAVIGYFGSPERALERGAEWALQNGYILIWARTDGLLIILSEGRAVWTGKFDTPPAQGIVLVAGPWAVFGSSGEFKVSKRDSHFSSAIDAKDSDAFTAVARVVTQRQDSQIVSIMKKDLIAGTVFDFTVNRAHQQLKESWFAANGSFNTLFFAQILNTTPSNNTIQLGDSSWSDSSALEGGYGVCVLTENSLVALSTVERPGSARATFETVTITKGGRSFGEWSFSNPKDKPPRDAKSFIESASTKDALVALASTGQLAAVRKLILAPASANPVDSSFSVNVAAAVEIKGEGDNPRPRHFFAWRGEAIGSTKHVVNQFEAFESYWAERPDLANKKQVRAACAARLALADDPGREGAPDAEAQDALMPLLQALAAVDWFNYGWSADPIGGLR
jgi:hypothetical protein